MGKIVADQDATALDSLLKKVYQDRGYDFREYKRGTVTRRLERRFHATGAKTYLDYMQFLDAHPKEYQKFADALTIKGKSECLDTKAKIYKKNGRTL